MGPKDYGILITDRRTIFVLEKASKSAVLGAIGDALVTDKKVVDYSKADIEELASDDKNLVIQNHDVQSVLVKKGISTYTLIVKHGDIHGKRKTVKAYLYPPDELVSRKTGDGMTRKQVSEYYADSVRGAFEAAMPPMVFKRGD